MEGLRQAHLRIKISQQVGQRRVEALILCVCKDQLPCSMKSKLCKTLHVLASSPDSKPGCMDAESKIEEEERSGGEICSHLLAQCKHV